MTNNVQAYIGDIQSTLIILYDHGPSHREPFSPMALNAGRIRNTEDDPVTPKT